MYDYNFATGDTGQLIKEGDAAVLYKTAHAIKPKTIVEIGANTGSSSTVFGTIVKETGGHLYSIEPEPLPKWYENMERLGLSKVSTLIEAYSPWLSPEQMDMIPKPIDYLFIDGDHWTQSCLTDYYFWQHYVRRSGRIAIHDWCNVGRIAQMIRMAVNIILETDCLYEVGRYDTSLDFDDVPVFGTIVFEKTF